MGADCAIQQRLRHPSASVEQLPKAEYALLRGGCGISCESREGRLLTSLARGVWHVLRNGRRPLLARSAMQGGGRAIFASYSKPPRRNRRRRATRSRRPDCPRRECVPPRRDALRDGADGTRLEGCGSAARLALVAEASPSKSRAWLSPQLSR